MDEVGAFLVGALIGMSIVILTVMDSDSIVEVKDIRGAPLTVEYQDQFYKLVPLEIK